jgi:hypothetical protein
MADFSVAYLNGQVVKYSGPGARYDIDGKTAVLTVRDGKGNRWRFSPAGWVSVEDDESAGGEKAYGPRIS